MELVNRKSPLPVDVLLPEIVWSLQPNRNLVVEAPPGAGKTTRVPPALLGIVGGEVGGPRAASDSGTNGGAASRMGAWRTGR